MNSLKSKFTKMAAIVREDGFGTLLKRAGQWIKTRFVDSGDTHWYVKTVTTDDEMPDFDGFTVKYAQSPADHERLDRLRPLDPAIQALRESVGGRRWAVSDADGEVAFTCWTFRDSAIVAERPALKLPLPEGTYQLEDSYVPKAMRKSRGSVLAVELISSQLLAETGVPKLSYFTKIDAENIAAQKALGYGNWHKFAEVSATRWLSRFTSWKVLEQDQPEPFPQLNELAGA